MGLLFHARATLTPGPVLFPASRGSADIQPAATLLEAIVAHLAGDRDRFDELFTEDVTCTSPHSYVCSRAEMDAAFGSPEESLTDRTVVLRSLAPAGEDVVAEWTMTAVLTGPVLLDDDILVEPTGDRVRLSGASFATFRGPQICSIRHYFDDSEILDQIRHIGRLGRWLAQRRPACESAPNGPSD